MTKTFRPVGTRVCGRLALAVIAAVLLTLSGSGPRVHALGNPIVVENDQDGTTDSWDISGAGDPSIQGFATDISVNTGQTANFKIRTTSANFKIDIYRLGYYHGAGARKMATLGPFTTPQNQAVACATDTATGLVDCGTWAVSASWNTTGAVSGIYIARLTRFDGTGGASHIVFVVRDDARHADVVVQTSDTTWQAYNRYGGASLYCAPVGIGANNAGTAYFSATCPDRALKVSYNRPFDTRDHDARSFLFSAEYPMVRWLEANGYDVKYVSGVDTDRGAANLVGAAKPKLFISSGHDEYWSGGQRASVEAARNAGVHLAFFSGNEMFWKTRYEPSIDGLNTAYRTLVTYKETLAGAKIDPAVDGTGHPIWTGTWRDPRFSPPADGGRPENGVTGTFWTVNSGDAAITVPAEMGHLRLWRNTSVATLAPGAVASLSSESLGYEWDEDLDNGARPAGLVRLSSTTVAGVEKILDYGSTVGIGTATHSLTLYRHSGGALVFGAGTVQWAWGLDSQHDGGSSSAAHLTHPDMQQATANLLADMGAQPGSPQPGLVAAFASTDTIAPTSAIISPAQGSSVQGGTHVTVSGTASDADGTIAGVEVSIDGGTTWHPAQGTSAWSYDWVTGTSGQMTIKTRAIDDSGNVEVPGPGTTVTVGAGVCPCTSLWSPTTIPALASADDTNAVELGVKFRSDNSGFITGIRFYKGVGNDGLHLGHLWSSSGTLLATATFTGETSSGWQQVLFGTPVPITADTTYVASYFAPTGHYAVNSGYFATVGVDSPPLHAPAVGNGVFSYGASPSFPTSSFLATNYWVDVVFAPNSADTTPPVISGVHSSILDSSAAIITWATNEDASSRVEYSTDVTFANSVSNGTFLTAHHLTLTGLSAHTTYYYRVISVDRAGNTATAEPRSFIMPGPTLHDTTEAHFGAGTRTGTYVSQTDDGELTLAPTAGTEFSGVTLSPGWISVPWQAGGFSILSNGVLMADGARVATCVTDANGVCLPEPAFGTTPSAIFGAPRSLEFSARFSSETFQHAGLGVTFSADEPWAIFSTSNQNAVLFARTNDGLGTLIDTPLGTGLLGTFHRYRIDWKAGSVDYYVDDVLAVSHALTVAGPLRPVAASDFNPNGSSVFVDWMRMTPYATPGTFVSRVFNAGAAPVDWHSIQWTSTIPSGTSLAISVRTGDSPAPDGSWTAFVPVSPGPLALTSRFIQYGVVMTTTNSSLTPVLQDIIISTDHAPVAVADSVTVPVNQASVFPSSGPGALTFNDTDADANDVLRVVDVTQPSHGTAILNDDGSVTYTPFASYSGPDAFTYTVSDGLLTASGGVTLSVQAGSPPVALDDSATVLEDSGATTITVLANDSDPDPGQTPTVTAVTQGAHGSVSIVGGGTAVSYTPQPNFSGNDSFIYIVGDGHGGSAAAAVNVAVTPVNDAPSFTKGADPSLLDTTAPQTIPGWATAITAGPPDEAGQSLTFQVSSDSPAMFTVQPSVALNGTLTFDPSPNANGTAVVTVTLRDNGGTANGGLDTSVQTFTITVIQTVVLTVPTDFESVASNQTLDATVTGLDPATVNRVQFLANGTVVGFATTAPYSIIWNTTTLANGPAVLTARACGDATCTIVRATSSPVNVTVSNVTTGARIVVTVPANDATVGGTVSLSATPAGTATINRVQFLVNGVIVANDTTSPYSGSWTSTPGPNGPALVTARACGTGSTATTCVGTLATSAAVHVTVNNSIVMTAPANNAAVNGLVTLSAKVSGFTGFNRIRFLVNGSPVQPAGDVTVTTPGVYSIHWNSLTVANSPPQAAITAIVCGDAACGTVLATSGPVNVNVNNNAPLLITGPANNATVGGNTTIYATVAGIAGLQRVQFLVNGSSAATVGLPADGFVPATAGGVYSIAWNSAANSNALEGSATITVNACGSDAGACVVLASAPAVTVHISNVGLVASYDFNEPISVAGAIDGAVSSVAGDVASNGTFSATGITRVADRSAVSGGALLFNGTSGMVTVPDATSLHLTTAMTLSAWVYSTSSTGWRDVLMKQYSTSTSNGLAYSLYASSGTDGGPGSYIHRTTTASDEHSTSPIQVGLGEWHHITATLATPALKIYVDGVLMATYTFTGSAGMRTSTLPLFLGGNPLWSEFFAGVLDDVKIYNRALSQAEITTMAAGK